MGGKSTFIRQVKLFFLALLSTLEYKLRIETESVFQVGYVWTSFLLESDIFCVNNIILSLISPIRYAAGIVTWMRKFGVVKHLLLSGWCV